MKLHKFIIATFVALLMGTFVAAITFAQEGDPQRPSGSNPQAQQAPPTQFESALGDGKRSMEDYVADQGSFLIDFGNVLVSGSETAGGKYSLGAIGMTNNMIAGLYGAPPASGVQYFAQMFQDFGLAEPAYAQTGTGFNALTPLLPLWRAFRNFTYVLFVILFAGVGLAIMFRMRLSPQAVITVQSALPRMISALLLVTFSYAIAGLAIDLMYVFIGVAALLFGGVVGNAGGYQEQFLRGNFGDTFGALWGQIGTQNFLITSGASAGMGAFLGTVANLSGMLRLALGGVGGGWAAVIGGSLVILIYSIILLFALFRIFIQLLQSYIAIIILVVTAPLQISLGVIPGFPGFGSWFKNLVANILVFPAVGIVLMMGLVIVETMGGGLWTPPYLLNPFGAISNSVSALIGLGILLVVHQVPQAVKAAMGIRGLGIVPQVPGPVGAIPGGAALVGASSAARYLDSQAVGGASPVASAIRTIFRIR